MMNGLRRVYEQCFSQICRCKPVLVNSPHHSVGFLFLDLHPPAASPVARRLHISHTHKSLTHKSLTHKSLTQITHTHTHHSHTNQKQTNHSHAGVALSYMDCHFARQACHFLTWTVTWRGRRALTGQGDALGCGRGAAGRRTLCAGCVGLGNRDSLSASQAWHFFTYI